MTRGPDPERPGIYRFRPADRRDGRPRSSSADRVAAGRDFQTRSFSPLSAVDLGMIHGSGAARIPERRDRRYRAWGRQRGGAESAGNAHLCSGLRLDWPPGAGGHSRARPPAGRPCRGCARRPTPPRGPARSVIGVRLSRREAAHGLDRGRPAQDAPHRVAVPETHLGGVDGLSAGVVGPPQPIAEAKRHRGRVGVQQDAHRVGLSWDWVASSKPKPAAASMSHIITAAWSATMQRRVPLSWKASSVLTCPARAVSRVATSRRSGLSAMVRRARA